MNICIICEYGWIIKGKEGYSDDKRIDLDDASVVRRWSNRKGIGGIAKEENKDEYTLDPIGKVSIMKSKVLFIIPCEW